jgi:hypothetical protein
LIRLCKPKIEYPDIPTFLLYYSKGRKKQLWDGQPLYLPTLILPKSKFFFMFNYSDKPEEIDDTPLE